MVKRPIITAKASFFFSSLLALLFQVMRNLNGNRRGACLRDPWQVDNACASDVSLKSIEVLGTPITCCTYDSALQRVKMLAREPRAAAVCPANTHILGEARHNLEFASRLARFDLVLPDGMPIVWSLNVRGADLKDRVYGPYFMRHVLRSTPRPWRHFFFGDSHECLDDLRRMLLQLQPDIELGGVLTPQFRPITE